MILPLWSPKTNRISLGKPRMLQQTVQLDELELLVVQNTSKFFSELREDVLKLPGTLKLPEKLHDHVCMNSAPNREFLVLGFLKASRPTKGMDEFLGLLGVQNQPSNLRSVMFEGFSRVVCTGCMEMEKESEREEKERVNGERDWCV